MPFRLRNALLLTAFADAAAIGLVIPAYPSLLLELGASSYADAARAGIALLMVHAVLQAIAAPLVGRLSDRTGRGMWLLLSVAASSVDYWIAAAGAGLGALMAGRALVGACSHTTAMITATIADHVGADERARWFGYRNAAWGAGITVAPLAGGWLAMTNVRAPFIVAAILTGLVSLAWMRTGLASVVSMGRRRLPRSSSEDVPQGMDASALRMGITLTARSGFLALLAGWALWQLATHAIPSSWSYFTMHRFAWTAQDVGLSLSVFGALYALVQATLVSPVVRRLGIQQTVIAGLALYVVAFLGYAFAPTSLTLMLFAVPLAAASITSPALRSTLSNAVGANAQGVLSGTIAALRAMTAIVAPPVMMGSFSVLAAAELHYDLAGAPFLIAASASLGALLLSWRAFRATRS